MKEYPGDNRTFIFGLVLYEVIKYNCKGLRVKHYY